MMSTDPYSSRLDKKAKVIGISLTVLFHLGLVFLSFGAGLKYTYPPPAETAILLDFIEEEPVPIEVRSGVEPRAKDARPENEIRLVQKSEAPVEGLSENKGIETTVGTDGDVEIPEPPRPKPIDRRALFVSNNNTQDTLAAQTAEKKSDRLTAGHPEGNTRKGSVEGAPQAKLQGRSVVGSLPQPAYEVESEGKVVVTIKVDQYGKVTSAIPGAKGTTVQNAVLWEAARKAALKAQFNLSSSAPSVQEGTITYVFKLK